MYEQCSRCRFFAEKKTPCSQNCSLYHYNFDWNETNKCFVTIRGVWLCSMDAMKVIKFCSLDCFIKSCFSFRIKDSKLIAQTSAHGLRTPNEGINQRYLKNWADVADKIGMFRPYLKIWDCDWIFGRGVKAIFSLGVGSRWCVISFWYKKMGSKVEIALKYIIMHKWKH